MLELTGLLWFPAHGGGTSPVWRLRSVVRRGLVCLYQLCESAVHIHGVTVRAISKREVPAWRIWQSSRCSVARGTFGLLSPMLLRAPEVVYVGIGFAGCSIGEFFAALPRRMSRIETKTPPMSCPLTESQTRRWQLPEASVRAEYSIRRSLSTALMRLTRILLPAALSAVSFAASSRGLGIVTGCLVEVGNGVLQWVRSFVSWGGGALCA